MHPTDFLQLPPAVRIVFVVLLWPAIWAGALMIVALAGDVIRNAKMQTTARSVCHENGPQHGAHVR